MKPIKKVSECFDYHECAEYIEKKLGYNLRDTLGKFAKSPYDDSIEYRDFWHFFYDTQNIHNGCYVVIGSDWLETANEWQKEIINAFIEEFGDTQYYWVEW